MLQPLSRFLQESGLASAHSIGVLDGVQDSRAVKDCTSRSFLSFLRPGSRSRLLLDLSSCKHPYLSEQLNHSCKHPYRI